MSNRTPAARPLAARNRRGHVSTEIEPCAFARVTTLSSVENMQASSTTSARSQTARIAVFAPPGADCCEESAAACSGRPVFVRAARARSNRLLLAGDLPRRLRRRCSACMLASGPITLLTCGFAIAFSRRRKHGERGDADAQNRCAFAMPAGTNWLLRNCSRMPAA